MKGEKTMKNEKVIFCNIAWMKEYKGITVDDIPKNGGSFVKENNDCCECTNFLDLNHKCYGFIQNKGNSLHIERLDQKYANNHGIMAKPEMPPANNCMIGMLPWIEFTNYTPIPYAPMNSFFPVIQAGKFFEKDGRKMMPLSITVHHAACDGYHVGVFCNKFQEYMNCPEKWMK